MLPVETQPGRIALKNWAAIAAEAPPPGDHGDELVDIYERDPRQKALSLDVSKNHHGD